MSFITNAPDKTLQGRLEALLQHAQELKFLVGYFYFSGYSALYDALRKAFEQNPDLRLKVLVGLSVDTSLGQLLEVARAQRKASNQEVIEALLSDLQKALSHPQLDDKTLPEQARFFLSLLRTGRLELRKTRSPTHAKLYLFKVKPDLLGLLPAGGSFLTGSSNLTQTGLGGQLEFNVEIKDYGFKEAEEFFDNLWQESVELLPKDVDRVQYIVERASLAASPTPLEVYALLLRRYLDTLDSRPQRAGMADFLTRVGFIPYAYTLDAANLLTHLLEEHGGAILADVVGLGKTVVACLVARESGYRGIVLAPPHLIGEPGSGGWSDYLERFHLYDWRTFSTGQLEDALRFVEGSGRDVQLVVVDEAHRFRNLETKDYALLSAITRGRKVLLLTATPINNRPLDAYALLRLFIPPKASTVGPSLDLESEFTRLDTTFRKASYALRYHDSKDAAKRRKAEQLYAQLTGENSSVDPRRLREILEAVAYRARLIMAPVMVRRNRRDLLEDPRYRKDAPPFPSVRDPEVLFYFLSPEQSRFYDEFLQGMGPDGAYRGALYQPELYRLGKEEIDESLPPEEAFALSSQRNLADFMRRLLVRRFESSLAAFVLTVKRMIRYHQRLLDFARDQGYFLLDRKTLDWLTEAVEEGPLGDSGLEEVLEAKIREEEAAIQRGERARRRYYRAKDFPQQRWQALLQHIEEDRAFLERMLERAEGLGLDKPDRDPKVQALWCFLRESLAREPNRKIVVFSEFTDTVEYLKQALASSGFRVLAVGKDYSKTLAKEVILNFDAAVEASHQRNEYQVLITSDRLSEGINLNRAGTVVNYDIPWNPTRVIQRLGRVNRVGSKLFDEVYIYHFFPTEQGAAVNDPKRVAENKLLLIHRALGEDAKILSPKEEPTAAQIYQRLTRLPPEDTEVSPETWARREWERLVATYPDLPQRIRDLPNRVKVGMDGQEPQALVVARKGAAFFALRWRFGEKPSEKESEEKALQQKPEEKPPEQKSEEGARQQKLKEEPPEYLFLPQVWDLFAGVEHKPRREPTRRFWEIYNAFSKYLEGGSEAALGSNALESRALNNLRTALNRTEFDEEERELMRVLEKDLQYHRLLPRYLVRRLQEADLGREGTLEAFRQVLQEIRERFAPLLRKIDTPPPQVDLLVGVEVQSPSPS